MTTQFVRSADGAKLAYDVTGQGRVLLLLHGAGKVRRDWHRAGYVQGLQDSFSVVTMDLRGAGQSDLRTSATDFAIDKMAADVLAVADSCSEDRFLILGYSLGGAIARHLAASCERVAATVVIGVALGPAVDEAFDRYIDSFVAKWGSGSQESGNTRAGTRVSKIKSRMPALAACFQAMRTWPPVQPSDLRCPTLVLSGTKNAGAASWLEANVCELDQHGIRVQWLEGLNHPQEFTRVDVTLPPARDFLSQFVA